MSTDQASEVELQAYIDGVLEPGRRAQLAIQLAHDAALATRLAAHAKDRDRLRAAIADAARSTPPPDWARMIAAATGGTAAAVPASLPTPQHRSALQRRSAIAAGIAVLLVGGGAALLLERRDDATLPDAILADAQTARDGTAGDTITPGFDTVPANAQLSATLGQPVRIPDMARFGFQLVGMHLSGHAAQLSYRDARLRLLTIYVRPSSGKPRFDLLHQGPTRICIWQDDVIGAVIMGPMDAGEMMRVASRAYADLNL